LKSLEKLEQAGMVHYDLKANNIIMDDAYHRPIIIDFGISFLVADLRGDPPDVSAYRRIFYNDYNKYPPWCIEIVLMSYLAQRTEFKLDQPVTPEHVSDMQALSRTYIDQVYKNLQRPSSETTRRAPSPLENALDSLWPSMVNQPIQAWAKRLTMNMYSWDNYALAMIMHDRLSGSMIPSSQLLSAYRSALTDIILSDPGNRLTAKDTRDRIRELLERNEVGSADQ